MQAIQDETKILTVEKVTKSTRGVTAREKKFLFNYLREGDVPENMRTVSNDKNENVKITEGPEDYISNVMLIVEFFLNCGFIPTLL